MKENSRLLAVDPSLRSSGWALFALDQTRLERVGVIIALGASLSLPERLGDLQNKITSLYGELALGSGDYLVCEGPAPLVLNPKTAILIEQVRSIFETLARDKGVSVPGRINPRSVHVELLGSGGRQPDRESIKLMARETADRLYGNFFRAGISDSGRKEILTSGIGAKSGKLSSLSQDIVDALLVGTVAATRLNLALRSGLCVMKTFSPQASARSSTTTYRRDRAKWDVLVQKRRK